MFAQLKADSAGPDWPGQLRAVVRRYRALDHVHVVPLLVTRPLATPLGLRPRGTLRPLEDISAIPVSVFRGHLPWRVWSLPAGLG